MTPTEAMRLIITHSTAATRAASQALQAIQFGSPILERRIRDAIDTALRDQTAQFTSEEAQALRMVYADLIRENAPRDADLRIRVTPAEKAQVERAAAAAQLTLSAYVRMKLDLED